MTDPLTEFLNARLDEREDQYGNAAEIYGWELADVAAKRKLVEFWSRAYRNPIDAATFRGPYWSRVRENGQWTLRMLALPFADHPDYRPEWAPDAP